MNLIEARSLGVGVSPIGIYYWKEAIMTMVVCMIQYINDSDRT